MLLQRTFALQDLSVGSVIERMLYLIKLLEEGFDFGRNGWPFGLAFRVFHGCTFGLLLFVHLLHDTLTHLLLAGCLQLDGLSHLLPLIVLRRSTSALDEELLLQHYAGRYLGVVVGAAEVGDTAEEVTVVLFGAVVSSACERLSVAACGDVLCTLLGFFLLANAESGPPNADNRTFAFWTRIGSTGETRFGRAGGGAEAVGIGVGVGVGAGVEDDVGGWAAGGIAGAGRIGVSVGALTEVGRMMTGAGGS